MKVAVTGASGFVGRHVVAELDWHQVDVTAITRDPLRLETRPQGVHILAMDIAEPGEDAFDRMGRPDILIHLAWDGLPNYASHHHFEVELPRQYRFLKNLIEKGLSSVFVAGTCFEYGMQSGALSEDLATCPCTPYGLAKDALHRQLRFLKNERPFSLTWGRLFYLYGEGQVASSLYSMLKKAVACGEPVFNMSGGEQLRDYLAVAEAARMIVRLALSGRDIGTVNVCSGRPVSVRNLVERWLRANNWKVELNLGHYPYPAHEPMAFWGDSTRACRELASLRSYI